DAERRADERGEAPPGLAAREHELEPGVGEHHGVVERAGLAQCRVLGVVLDEARRASVGKAERRTHRAELHFVAQPAGQAVRPAISGGGSMSSMWSTVGPTSHRAPPCRSGPATSSPTIRKGTGFVVCAVCGPFVVGSIISSQLPWSAVTSSVAPRRSALLTTR